MLDQFSRFRSRRKSLKLGNKFLVTVSLFKSNFCEILVEPKNPLGFWYTSISAELSCFVVVFVLSTTITVDLRLDNCLVSIGLDKYFPAFPYPYPHQKFWTQASTKLSFKPPTHSRIFCLKGLFFAHENSCLNLFKQYRIQAETEFQQNLNCKIGPSVGRI